MPAAHNGLCGQLDALGTGLSVENARNLGAVRRPEPLVAHGSAQGSVETVLCAVWELNCLLLTRAGLVCLPP